MTRARSLITALTSAVVLVLLFFYGPQWILTALPVGSRALKAWLATGWVVFALAVCTWWGWRTSAAAPRRALASRRTTPRGTA